MPNNAVLLYCSKAFLSLMATSHSSFAVLIQKPSTLSSEIGCGSSSSKALTTFLMAKSVVVLPLPGMPFNNNPHFCSCEVSQCATSFNRCCCKSLLMYWCKPLSTTDSKAQSKPFLHKVSSIGSLERFGIDFSVRRFRNKSTSSLLFLFRKSILYITF